MPKRQYNLVVLLSVAGILIWAKKRKARIYAARLAEGGWQWRPKAGRGAR